MIYHSKIYSTEIFSKIVDLQNIIYSAKNSNYRTYPYFHSIVEIMYEDLMIDLGNIQGLVNYDEINSKIKKHYKYYFIKKDLLKRNTKRTRVINNMFNFTVELKNNIVFSLLEKSKIYNYNNKYDSEEYVKDRLQTIFNCFRQINNKIIHYNVLFPNAVCVDIVKEISYYLHRVSSISRNLLDFSHHDKYDNDYKEFFETVFVSLRNLDLADFRLGKDDINRIRLIEGNFTRYYDNLE